MWLVIFAMSLGALILLARRLRPWRGSGHGDLGVMSQQWLAEHRASGR